MNQNPQEFNAASNQVYDLASSNHGICSAAVKWDNPQTQYLRFAELVKYLDLYDQKKSVLDVECGNAELYKYLNHQGFRGDYTGYDINSSLLQQARHGFPGINVFQHDINQQVVLSEFDYVLSSGVFNLDFGQSLKFIHDFITNMFSHSRHVLVFNAISTHVNYRDQQMYYIDPSQIFRFCLENLSKRIVLSHGLLPFNYTIAIYKESRWGPTVERS